MELGLLQVVVVVALPVGGGCVLPHSKNLASPEMTAVEERKDLLGLGDIQRTLRGWQCTAGRLGRHGEIYGQDSGGGSVVLLLMTGSFSIF